MRLFRTILVLALLIAFPAISWYYLSKGADWRRSGLSELETKNLIRLDSDIIDTEGEVLDLYGVYTIAADGDNLSGVSADLLDKLEDQYNYRKDVTLLYIGETEKNLARGWRRVDCDKNDCKLLRSAFFPGGPNAVLVDDSLNLRRGYDLTDEDDVKRLIEHTAILFPVEKRAKIELDRGSDE